MVNQKSNQTCISMGISKRVFWTRGRFIIFGVSVLKDSVVSIEIQLMRKLLSDHFSLSASLPSEFEENFLSMFSRHTMKIANSLTHIIKLGP